RKNILQTVAVVVAQQYPVFKLLRKHRFVLRRIGIAPLASLLHSQVGINLAQHAVEDKKVFATVFVQVDSRELGCVESAAPGVKQWAGGCGDRYIGALPEA